MREITVSASRKYNVFIGSNILNQLGDFLVKRNIAGKIAVISDSNVFPLYGERVICNLRDAGYETYSFTFPAGEESKNQHTYFQILTFLAEHHFTRADTIVALGGGVVGDISGFAAATYLRGIAYIQVPTSLLAMVDSSVGGKTAIDLPAGKNLVGAFYQPQMVLCDIEVLSTLPHMVFRDGCAEIIKYGILYDPKLFGHLAANGLAFDRESVIARCVELKRDVVAADEYDTGARQKLNLGHTVGHAIEAVSQYTVTHGQAVAIGTAIIARSAVANCMCSEDALKCIEDTLLNFGLPITTDSDAATLAQIALSDKKRAGGYVNLIVPQEIGNCLIYKIAVEQLEHFIKAGL